MKYQTPTESGGGALLYITDNLNCKPRNDLHNIMYLVNLNLSLLKLLI